MQLKIEKSIPLPARKKMSSHFGEMDVGDSFYTEDIKIGANFRMHAYRQSPKWKVSQRKEGSGLRFWRVA